MTSRESTTYTPPIGSPEGIERKIAENDGIMRAEDLVRLFQYRVDVARHSGLVPDELDEPVEWHEDSEWLTGDDEMTMTTAQQHAVTALNQTFDDLGIDIEDAYEWQHKFTGGVEFIDYITAAQAKFDDNYLKLVNPEERIEGGQNG